MDSFRQCNISSQKSVDDGEGRTVSFCPIKLSSTFASAYTSASASMSISIYKTVTADLIVQNPKVEVVPNVFNWTLPFLHLTYNLRFLILQAADFISKS